MAWYDSLVDIGSKGLEGLGGLWDSLNDGKGIEANQLVGLLGSLAANEFGWFDSDQEKVGYQGKVPRYSAVRERVPIDYGDEGRRPGEYGRRYFTDTTYAKRPEGGIPSLPEAQAAASQQAMELAEANRMNRPGLYGGGIASLGMYLGGPTDGMGDKVPIDAADGEFIIPADVVGHLGNGNSNAGAQELYSMMDRIRQARTGSKQQGKRIAPNKFMPV